MHENTKTQAKIHSNPGKKRLKRWQEKTLRQARKNAKAGEERLKRRQGKTQTQARKAFLNAGKKMPQTQV